MQSSNLHAVIHYYVIGVHTVMLSKIHDIVYVEKHILHVYRCFMTGSRTFKCALYSKYNVEGMFKFVIRPIIILL